MPNTEDNTRVKQPLIIQEIEVPKEVKEAQNYADLIRRQGTLSPDFGNNYFAANSYYHKHTTPEQKAVHQQSTEEKKARDVERALNFSEILFPSTWWNGVTTWTGNENLNINNPSAKLAFDLITPFGASLLSNGIKGGIRLGQGIVNTTSRKTLFNRLVHPIETVKFAKINNATENLLRQTYPQSEEMIQGYRPVIKNTKYYNGNPHGENNGLYFLGDEIIGLGGNKKLGNTVTMWDRAHEFGHVVDAGQKTMQKKPFTGIKGWRYGNETSPDVLAEEFASDVLATNLFPNTKPGLSYFDIDPYIARQNAVRGISYGDIYVPGKNNIISFNLGKTTPVNNLTAHLQGDEAVKMFKEYGGEQIPEGSINGEQLRKYVAETRERYGLTGNNNITDEEIAQALYKHSKELGGNTAAVNAQGEPQLLFRGSTRRNTELHPKGIVEQSVSGADNILGNLFLGELPGTRPGQGLERYLGLNQGWLGVTPPQTRAANVIGTKTSYPLYEGKLGLVEKLSPESMEFGANDINAFIVRTPKVRNATEEIVVSNPLSMIPKNKLLGQTYEEHYRNLIKDAESKGEGLLRSDPAFDIKEMSSFSGGEIIDGKITHPTLQVKKELIPKFRDEHENYTYFALPNFNIRNAKHLLPYDLRIPRNWTDPNIYKTISIPLIFNSGVKLISNKKKLSSISIQEEQ